MSTSRTSGATWSRITRSEAPLRASVAQLSESRQETEQTGNLSRSMSEPRAASMEGDGRCVRTWPCDEEEYGRECVHGPERMGWSERAYESGSAGALARDARLALVATRIQ